ncbi:MAG TPA: aminoacyl-tRNA hydrolase [Patescibacteria group bacterium]|jgi:PTH1 family peptidyl-tRNA hydrolase|nr:aminoacyl-tRNA hydrolase [Patescibacteria group bacterium]
MKLIVGLGNPGLKHEKTRHNLGFIIVDAFLKDFSSAPAVPFATEKKFQAEIAEINWQPKNRKVEKVILAKPLTYMNGSGSAVSLISQFYKIKPEEIWVIHDEIDLPLGGMKIRFGGASAGHKGVESIIEHLGTDKFWRFRIGIGAQHEKVHDRKVKAIDNYVLSEFSEGERGKAREIIKKSVKAVQDALEEGLEKAMNRFNTK